MAMYTGLGRVGQVVADELVPPAVAHAAAAAADQLGDQVRNVDQRRREDHRDNAGLVDLQRQIGRGAAVHPPAHHALGVLHRDAALALLDEHHADDDDQRGHADRGEHHAAAAVQDGLAFGRDAGGDAREDQQRHAVADAALGDQLAHPHHQRRARGHHQHDDDQGEDALVRRMMSRVQPCSSPPLAASATMLVACRMASAIAR